jgi:hypothetical protein
MHSKKSYIKPLVKLINLDNSITLLMTSNPGPRGPTGGGSKGSPGNGSDPFASPFGDKPFN